LVFVSACLDSREISDQKQKKAASSRRTPNSPPDHSPKNRVNFRRSFSNPFAAVSHSHTTSTRHPPRRSAAPPPDPVPDSAGPSSSNTRSASPASGFSDTHANAKNTRAHR
jgi:hypothetical protein